MCVCVPFALLTSSDPRIRHIEPDHQGIEPRLSVNTERTGCLALRLRKNTPEEGKVLAVLKTQPYRIARGGRGAGRGVRGRSPGTPGPRVRDGRSSPTPPPQKDTAERRQLVDLCERQREVCFVLGSEKPSFISHCACVRACT